MFLNIPGALRVASAHHLVALRCRIWPTDLGDRCQGMAFGHRLRMAAAGRRDGSPGRSQCSTGAGVVTLSRRLPGRRGQELHGTGQTDVGLCFGHFGLRLATDCFGLNESAHMFNKTFWALEYWIVLLILEEKLLQKRLTSKRRTAIVVRRATWHCGQTSCCKWQLESCWFVFFFLLFHERCDVDDQDVQYVELLGLSRFLDGAFSSAFARSIDSRGADVCWTWILCHLCLGWEVHPVETATLHWWCQKPSGTPQTRHFQRPKLAPVHVCDVGPKRWIVE